MKKLIVFIGRFQIFHRGHLAALKQALEQGEQVLMILGSANQSRSLRNPFTWEERKEMVKACLSISEQTKVAFDKVEDYPYSDSTWIAEVRSVVKKWSLNIATKGDIGLIGHKKDHTSEYLSFFQEWEFIPVDCFAKLNATTFRENYFSNKENYSDGELPEGVIKYLEEFKDGSEFLTLQRDLSSVAKGKMLWQSEGASLYGGSTFVTADAVVVVNGHILVVKRGPNSLGAGKLALPGGFVNTTETVKDAMLRELYEETRLKVPKKVLAGSIKTQELFDYPQRSDRGRVITQAFLIELADTTLPKVKGGDDACEANWLPLSQIKENQTNFFEDHYHIIKHMLRLS